MAVKIDSYKGNDYENAVVRIMSNNDRYVVFSSEKGSRRDEFLAQRSSKVAYNILEKITEEEYYNFGVTWDYGGKDFSKRYLKKHKI